MASRDIHNCLHYKRGLSPVAAVTNDTPFVSEIVDTAGYEAVEFVLLTGALADVDATFTVLVEDGDNASLTDNAAVADKFLLGTEALTSFTFAEDNKVFKIGYIGDKRYVRVTVTPANNTGNAFVAGVWVLGHARNEPSSNPPA